jgi:hypothetical protein
MGELLSASFQFWSGSFKLSRLAGKSVLEERCGFFAALIG